MPTSQTTPTGSLAVRTGVAADWHALKPLLRRRRILARPLGVVRSCQAETLTLRLAKPEDLGKIIEMTSALALATGTLSVRVVRDGHLVQLEATLREVDRQPLPLAELGLGLGYRLPLGLDTAGRVVTLDLTQTATPHCLVVSTTGGGKTTLLRTIVYGLSRQTHARLILIDGKNDGAAAFGPFAQLSHLVHPVVTDAGEARRVLEWCVDELARRAEGWTERLVIIIDELLTVLDAGAAQPLATLTSQGRGRGIHVVAATQHATADTIGGSWVKANLPCRIVGKVTSAPASVLATGRAGCDAHQLAGGGDMLLVAGADVTRLQVALASDEDLAALSKNERVGEARLSLGAKAEFRVEHPAQTARPVDPGDVAWAVAAAKDRTAPGLLAIRRHCRSSDGYARRVQKAAHERLSHPSQVSQPTLMPDLRLPRGDETGCDRCDGAMLRARAFE